MGLMVSERRFAEQGSLCVPARATLGTIGTSSRCPMRRAPGNVAANGLTVIVLPVIVCVLPNVEMTGNLRVAGNTDMAGLLNGSLLLLGRESRVLSPNDL